MLLPAAVLGSSIRNNNDALVVPQNAELTTDSDLGRTLLSKARALNENNQYT